MPTAGVGFFPLDEQLQLWEQHWSEQVAKQAVWLSGLVEFEDAADILAKVGQIAMSDTSVWRRTQIWGERCQAVEVSQQAAASALPPASQIVPGEAPQAKRQGAAMDGAKVNIRQEGWKELKVGCVFEVEVRPTRDKQTGEWVDLAHAVETTYVAHLGGPEIFGRAVWAEARQQQWAQAAETIVLGDGAPWIWNLVKEHFYDSRQAVDWYHATEHLWHAAHRLHGDGTAAARQWFKAYETPLFEGQAEVIADALSEAAQHKRKLAPDLRKAAHYFHENQRRMQYLELREDDFPIGSGMVESGCKQFRARFTGSGMRWSRSGLERLLPVRAAIMSRRFDALWQAAYHPLPLN